MLNDIAALVEVVWTTKVSKGAKDAKGLFGIISVYRQW
jgi:hypothetical protein